MSEIADACRPLETLASDVPNSVANEAWFQNWSVLAQRLDQLAAQAVEQKRDLSAGEYYFRASNYCLTAERNMAWSDSRRLATYRKALASFKMAYELSGHRTQRVEVSNKEGKPLAGYLRLPQGSGPFPALVCFNGFDSIKEMLYMLYAEGAVRRGIAILFIDQEGTGEAMRLHDIKKRVDSEASSAPFITYLQSRSDILSDSIGVAGVSNGGYDAPRAAAFDKRISCAACLGAFYNADDYVDRFDGDDHDAVRTASSDLDELMMRVMGTDEVVSAYRKFAERDLRGVLDRITVPLLIVHGENDRQVPPWHAARVAAEAANSSRLECKTFSLSEGGAEHCGIDNVHLQSNYLFDWAATVLGAKTSVGQS
jgi:fermentation-respiration switch protein FrsA (DUF1100 family)